MSAAAYRDYLRQLYRRDPGLFVRWARDACTRDVSLLGDRPGLVGVWYDALVRVALLHGWQIGEPLTADELLAIDAGAPERRMTANGASDLREGPPAP